MTAVVDIVNQAAQQMGARAQCTSVFPSDGSPLSNAATLLYTTQIQALLRAAHWNCARFQVVLSVLKAAVGTPENPNGTTLPIPPIPWAYEYAKPPDCLAGRFVITPPWPAPTAGTPPLTTGATAYQPQRVRTGYPFQLAVDYNTQTPPARVSVILSNVRQAQLVYTGDISDEPDLWDPSFANAAISLLSAWLVNPLNMKASLIGERISVLKGLLDQARISDGNEGVTPNDHVPDWIAVRTRYGGLGATDNSGYCAGWAALALPGGISY